MCSTSSDYQNHCQVYIPWMHASLSETVPISEAVPAKESKARQRSSLGRSVISLSLPRGAGVIWAKRRSSAWEWHLYYHQFPAREETTVPLKELSVPSSRLFSSSLTPSLKRVIKENTNKNQFRLEESSFFFFFPKKEPAEFQTPYDWWWEHEENISQYVANRNF